MKRASQILIHKGMIMANRAVTAKKIKFKQMKRLQENNLTGKRKILSVPFDK